MKSKHIAQRTCIACRQTRAKKDLVRLVYTKQEVVEINPSAKKPGRGAYLCPKRDCWEKGLKGNLLEHALRAKLSANSRQTLLEYSKDLP